MAIELNVDLPESIIIPPRTVPWPPTHLVVLWTVHSVSALMQEIKEA